jgi:hypothetical protein
VLVLGIWLRERQQTPSLEEAKAEEKAAVDDE